MAFRLRMISRCVNARLDASTDELVVYARWNLARATMHRISKVEFPLFPLCAAWAPLTSLFHTWVNLNLSENAWPFGVTELPRSSQLCCLYRFFIAFVSPRISSSFRLFHSERIAKYAKATEIIVKMRRFEKQFIRKHFYLKTIYFNNIYPNVTSTADHIEPRRTKD